MSSPSGALSTLDWPRPYRYSLGYRLDVTCSWKITPQRTNMMIVVMDIDFAVTANSSQPRDVLKLEYHGKYFKPDVRYLYLNLSKEPAYKTFLSCVLSRNIFVPDSYP